MARAFVRLAVLSAWFFVSGAFAQSLPPDVARGVAWLAGQVQSDGRLAGEATSIALPLQAEAESVVTLSQLTNAPSALVARVRTTPGAMTEYLARRALALAASRQGITAPITDLLALRNADGGFGSHAGYGSNALDTAFALQALAQADGADTAIKITGTDAATYTWDTNGQLQSKTKGSGATAQTTSYTFNARHLLEGVTQPDGTRIVYSYAPDGNLVARAKTQGGTTQTTHYLVDPNLAFAQVVAEYDDAGHATAIYVYGDELLLRLEPARSNRSTVYHHDGLGSVVALTDQVGAAIQAYGYDAWGNGVESTGADLNPYGYAGERYDADTGLIYLRARWYEASIGRFASSDEKGGYPMIPLSHNKYLYADAEPIGMVDPSGYQANLAEVGAVSSVMGISATAVKFTTFNVALLAANDALWTSAAVSGSTSASTYAAAGLGILTSFALTADSQRRDRFIGVPVIVFGKEFPMHAQHILDAETANGSNFNPAPFALNRVPPWRRGWYNMTVECGKVARARYPASMACDEYPFASSLQGGPVNYVIGGVSLRLLDLSESDSTRNFIGRFYSVAGISPDGISKGSRFIALGIPGARSFFTDRSGRVYPFGD